MDRKTKIRELWNGWRNGRAAGKQIKNWFDDDFFPSDQPLTVTSNGAVTEVLMYGPIDDFYDGISAKKFLDAIKDVKDDQKILLRINSPGGDVFQAMPIYNEIRRRGEQVEAIVEGLAASCASWIAVGANRLMMCETSMLMIHRAWGFTVGSVVDHQKSIDLLSKIDDQIAETYDRRTKKGKEKCLAQMDEETWFTAPEAVDGGFADGIAVYSRASEEKDNRARNANRLRLMNMRLGVAGRR